MCSIILKTCFQLTWLWLMAAARASPACCAAAAVRKPRLDSPAQPATADSEHFGRRVKRTSSISPRSGIICCQSYCAMACMTNMINHDSSPKNRLQMLGFN